MIFSNLQDGHLKTISAQHHSNLANGFGVEYFESFYIDIQQSHV